MILPGTWSYLGLLGLLLASTPFRQRITRQSPAAICCAAAQVHPWCSGASRWAWLALDPAVTAGYACALSLQICLVVSAFSGPC